MIQDSVKPTLGVCSWSLRPASPADLMRDVQAVGVQAVQLALDPLREQRWGIAETRTVLERAGITIRSGMMTTAGEDYATLESIRMTGGLRPDLHWAANRQRAVDNAALAQALDIGLVTLHAGFLPEDQNDPLHAVMVERLRAVADIFAEQGVRLGLETGQETAATLLKTLDAIGKANIGVNFDPANMILYGMGDPIAALNVLAPRVVQIHIKDGTPTGHTGAWGAEAVVGTGAVDWAAFFGVVEKHRLNCDCMLEREAGEQRVADLRAGREFVWPYLARLERRA